MADVKRRIWYDPDADVLYSHVRQDVEPILSANKRLRDLEQPNTDGLKHVASVPVAVLELWLNEEVARGATHLTLGSKEMDQLIRRKLRDPAWIHLRTDKPLPAFRR
jgi:hypothetical protein